MLKISLISIFLFSHLVIAQVGIGAANVDPKAILHIEAQGKGVLFPRVNAEKRDALIYTVPEGLVLYNTQSKCLEFWDGFRWVCAGKMPSSIPLSLNCDQIWVEGTFIKNVTTPTKIFLDVDYKGLKIGQAYPSDRIFIENIKGLRIQPHPTRLIIKGGENAVVHHVEIIPLEEGTGEFNISVSGKTCPVKITVEKEPEFRIYARGFLNQFGMVQIKAIPTEGFEITGYSTEWWIADDEKGKNKKRLDSKYSRSIILEEETNGKHLFYKTKIDYKKGDLTGQTTKEGLVRAVRDIKSIPTLETKITPLPKGYVPSIKRNGIFTTTSYRHYAEKYVEQKLCNYENISTLSIIPTNPKYIDYMPLENYDRLKIRNAVSTEDYEIDDRFKSNFRWANVEYFWWSDYEVKGLLETVLQFVYNPKTGKTKSKLAFKYVSVHAHTHYYDYPGLCIIPFGAE